MILLENMRISYSALESFQRCPLKFKFQYLDKIKAPKSKEALFGTLLHHTLKILHEPGLAIPTEEEILKYLADNWDSAIYNSEQESAMAFAQAVKILKNYYAKNYPAQFNVVALETPFEVPVAAGPELHLITGKIDRIDKTNENFFEVIDYKTSKKMPSQENVDNDLQLSVYHLGVANRWPSIVQEKRPIKVSLYYLKHGEKLSSFRTFEHLEATKEKILKSIENIQRSHQEEKFSPRPSPLCDWCEYQRFCPLFKHKFIEQKLFFNDQDIKALIGEYLAMKEEVEQKKERLDEIKADLSKFMDQQNMERLFSDDGYLTRQIIQRFKYDVNLLKEILEPLGRWPEVLKLDETKLKKIAKELPAEYRQKISATRQLEKEQKIFTVKREKKIKR